MAIINQFQEDLYLDFHTHRLRRTDRADIMEIVSLHLGKTPNEYDLYTIGKHPWWTSTVLSDEEISIFKAHFIAEKCLAMGEMGLDKLKGEPMAVQMDILRSQLDLAQELGKPVIIHCVRAIHQFLEVKKEYPSIKKWCIHGYARHAILAQQLIKSGCYLSLMPNFKTPLPPKYVELVASLPANRFFLETDSMPNILIEDVYLQVAKIRNITVEDLKRQMIQNAKSFFYE